MMRQAIIVLYVLLFLLPIALYVPASLHIKEFETDTYKSSDLIDIEITILIVAVIAHLVNGICTLVFFVNRNLKLAGISFLIGVISIMVLVGVMNIDAPTLLFMT